MLRSLITGHRCPRCASRLFYSRDPQDEPGTVYCIAGHSFTPAERPANRAGVRRPLYGPGYWSAAEAECRIMTSPTIIEKRAWMVRHEDRTVVSYHLAAGSLPVELEVTPLVTRRGFHALGTNVTWDEATVAGSQAAVRSGDVKTTIYLSASSGEWRVRGDTWSDFHHCDEAARGLDHTSNLCAPATLQVTPQPGEGVALVYSLAPVPLSERCPAPAAERERQAALLREGGAGPDPVEQQLTLATDQFLVRRDVDGSAGATIIAGYHWFHDWGRDTMIALVGLALATGRFGEAATILRTFARFLRDELLPTNFPDSADDVPGYNTVDATLWFAQGRPGL